MAGNEGVSMIGKTLGHYRCFLVCLAAVLYAGPAEAGICFGPVPSVRTLGTAEEAIFKPELLGFWALEEYRTFMIFERRRDSDDYQFTYIDIDSSTSGVGTGTYKGRLFRLGEHYILDIVPDDTVYEALIAAGQMPVWIFPLHTFHRVAIEGDRLRFGYLDCGWLEPEAPEVDLPHFLIEDDDLRVLTAASKELQGFFRVHAGDNEAFEEFPEFHRQDPAVGNLRLARVYREWHRYPEAEAAYQKFLALKADSTVEEEYVAFLVERRQDRQKRMDEELIAAARRGDAAAVRALIAARVDVNARDEAGFTALMEATEEGHADIVELLKKAGAKE
jgi:hypothetical protein